MKARLLWLIAAAFLFGCAHKLPPWSKASPEARASGEFTLDDAYLESQQFTNDILEDVDTVIRLKKQIGHEYAAPAHESLNHSLAKLQQVTATNAATAQQAWEAQVYVASPNVTAKVTTMVNPMDAKGRIMEQQILTYYDNGTMRYATNFFNLVK